MQPNINFSKTNYVFTLLSSITLIRKHVQK